MADPVTDPSTVPLVDAPPRLVFNGVHARGGYLRAPVTAEALGRALLDGGRLQAAEDGVTRSRGPMVGVDALRLESSGWGIIFPRDGDPAIRDALAPLRALRREQAGSRYREYVGEDGFHPDEDALSFLERHGTGPGPADPEVVPYYLLLVGGPETIPFAFEMDLNGPYAVGRLALSSVAGYAAYARAVVAAEGGAVKLPRRTAIFGVANPDDAATQQSRWHLAQPLAEALKERHGDWTVDGVMAEAAHRQRLIELFGADAPTLLFTASHGMGFDSGDRLQREHQGALLCSDWQGPQKAPGPVGSENYLTAADLPAGGFAGRIAFHFACFGGGTPTYDAFEREGVGSRLAPEPFVARLPQRLLEDPAGGALAVVGHVDRAWGYSFLWTGVGRQTQAFRGAMSLLMQGAPVGMALDAFAQRNAALGRLLLRELHKEMQGGQVDPRTVSSLWTAATDAASYTILGDPAVRLPLEGGSNGL